MSKPLSDYAMYVTEKVSVIEVDEDNYISTDNMLSNKKGITKSVCVPTEGYVYRYQKGDVLVSNIRPYFKKVWLADKNGGCCADVLIFRPTNVTSEFLYAILSQDSFFEYVMAGSKGSKMPRGDKKHIMSFRVKDVKNQKLVGELLNVLEQKMESNTKLNNELEYMAETLYDYWFLQFDFPNEGGKPYKSSGGKMVWDEELKREIPEGWKSEKIGKLLGKISKTKTYNVADYSNGSKYPIVDQSKEYICGFTDDELSLIHLDDCIVFGDHTKIVKYINFPFARGADGTQIITSMKEEMPNYLLYQQIANMELVSQGYSRYFKFLKDKSVLIPSQSITQEYMGKVECMLRIMYKNRMENYELVKIRDFLLPLLVNGQVGFKE